MTTIAAIIDGETVWMGTDTGGLVYEGELDTYKSSKILRMKIDDDDLLCGISGNHIVNNVLSDMEGTLSLFEDDDPVRQIRKTVVEPFRVTLKERGMMRDDDDGDYLIRGGGAVLLAFRGHIFLMASDLSIVEPALGFRAVGSGAYWAGGALYATQYLGLDARKRLELALEASAHYDQYSRAPFDIVKL